MKWSILVSVAIGLLTALGAGLAGHLSSKIWWHKWFFWGSGLVIVVLIYFQARMTKEPPSAAEISDAVSARLQNKTPQGFIADPKVAQIADQVAKNILQAQAIENQQICVRAFAVAKRLRDIESEANAELERNRQLHDGSDVGVEIFEAIHESEDAELRPIYGEVMFVYADMAARIKQSSGTPPDIPTKAQQFLSTGRLPRLVPISAEGGGYRGVDRHPLSPTAAFLELLAKKVCP
jgi:hypothetical protein